MFGDSVAVSDVPEGIAVVERWKHIGIDCAVGGVGGALYGLARLRDNHHAPRGYATDRGSVAEAVRPDRLGRWLALDLGPVGRFWSQEVLARFVAAGSAELCAWDQGGWVWAVQRGVREVNAVVDAVVAGREPAARVW